MQVSRNVLQLRDDATSAPPMTSENSVVVPGATSILPGELDYQKIISEAYAYLDAAKAQLGEKCYARAKAIMDAKVAGKAISDDDNHFMELVSAGNYAEACKSTDNSIPWWAWALGITVGVGVLWWMVD